MAHVIYMFVCFDKNDNCYPPKCGFRLFFLFLKSFFNTEWNCNCVKSWDGLFSPWVPLHWHPFPPPNPKLLAHQVQLVSGLSWLFSWLKISRRRSQVPQLWPEIWQQTRQILKNNIFFIILLLPSRCLTGID